VKDLVEKDAPELPRVAKQFRGEYDLPVAYVCGGV
jgi:hypothetical protein